jgi:hypothetical protein
LFWRGSFLERAISVKNDCIHGIDAVGYLTGAMELYSASFGPETPDMPVSDEFKMIDEAILKSPEQALFSLAHELAGFPCLATSTVHRPRLSLGSQFVP